MKRKCDDIISSDDRSTKFRKVMVPRPISAIDRSLLRKVRKLEGEREMKYSDNYLAATTIPFEGAGVNSWILQLLNPSTLGTSQANQRVGTQTDNKRLDIRLSLRSQTANIIDNRVRVLIFWMKNSNGNSATTPTLFDDALIANGGTYQPLNEQFKDTYKVVYDRLFELKPLDWNGTTTTIGDQISLNKSIKLGRKSRFALGAGTGTYTDVLDNALYMAVLTSSNSGVAGVANPLLTCYTRCWYFDT